MFFLAVQHNDLLGGTREKQTSIASSHEMAKAVSVLSLTRPEVRHPAMQSFRTTGERVIATVKTAPAQSPGQIFPSRIGAPEETSTAVVSVVVIFFFEVADMRFVGHHVIATVWGVT